MSLEVVLITPLGGGKAYAIRHIHPKTHAAEAESLLRLKTAKSRLEDRSEPVPSSPRTNCPSIFMRARVLIGHPLSRRLTCTSSCPFGFWPLRGIPCFRQGNYLGDKRIARLVRDRERPSIHQLPLQRDRIR